MTAAELLDALIPVLSDGPTGPTDQVVVRVGATRFDVSTVGWEPNPAGDLPGQPTGWLTVTTQETSL